jgi:ABC-2 type transport system ATP-binding protein
MTSGHLSIDVTNLTKRFHTVTAVSDLSFTVRPGSITGFLGPNGSGKTTTMRMILGLVAPTSGTATIGGRRYRDIPRPSATVGAVLDASAFHPGHTAREHLRIYCAMGGYPDRRADELLAVLGLADTANRRTRQFSTGMRQRLNLATALLGDPRVLLLDEPSNGLDPEGMAWLREFLRSLARDGRTILVSSHVLSELQQIVDDVVVIRGGRMVAAGALEELASGTLPPVLLRSPQADQLATLLNQHAADGMAASRVEDVEPGRLRVHGLRTEQIADLAARADVRLYEIGTEAANLEEWFLSLGDDRQGENR